MLISKILDNYEKEYPIYNLINFSVNGSSPEHLHPLFIITQYIIDKFIGDGNIRIAIVLPDDECNIIPMLLAKYFSNIQSVPGYAGSVVDEIEIGQHVRLGKAVVEFLGFCDEAEKRSIGLNDKIKYIKFRTGKKSPITVRCPMNGVHYLFEKTNGAVSSWETWNKAFDEAKREFTQESVIKNLKAKRTALKKTICLLSAKNDFKEFVSNIDINGTDFDDVVAYGEIDLDSSEKFRLYNKGRLDCLPSIAVTTKTEEIYYLLKDENIKNKVFAVFSTIDKFDELVSNPDTLKKILKQNIPFVAFVSESDFENCSLLTDFGFELWHWKPSTMKSEAFLINDSGTIHSEGKSLFGKFAEKINRAALSDFKMETSVNKDLKKSVYLIKLLSKQAGNGDSTLRQFVRRVWAFQNKLTCLISPKEGVVRDEIEDEFLEISDFWEQQKCFYTGQQIEITIENILNHFSSFLSANKTDKLLKLEAFLLKINPLQKSIKILVPNKYSYIEETFSHICTLKGNCNVYLQTLADFYAEQEKDFVGVDYLIVTWFDKDEYIRIKQSYCYENLLFILYDYENKWREHYMKRFDERIPHDIIKQTADKICFSEDDIYDKPLDRIFTEDTSEFEEISDYNLSNTIIRSTFTSAGVSQDSADAIECIPVILSEDKIAYFYPTHDVIDVTALSRGDIDRPMKKDAIKLKKGDKILVRQSGKDIIKEKADILMAQNGEIGLRDKTEIWSKLLSDFAENKSIVDVCKDLNNEGAECTFQQVRYWLSGETIMPRNKDILIAIGIVTSREARLKDLSDKYLENIDTIFEAGKKIQGYHQNAGRWLTNELKSKASEIKIIANSSIPHGNIEAIGDINIYTVEDILDKEIISRGRINKLEDLY